MPNLAGSRPPDWAPQLTVDIKAPLPVSGLRGFLLVRRSPPGLGRLLRHPARTEQRHPGLCGRGGCPDRGGHPAKREEVFQAAVLLVQQNKLVEALSQTDKDGRLIAGRQSRIFGCNFFVG